MKSNVSLEDEFALFVQEISSLDVPKASTNILVPVTSSITQSSNNENTRSPASHLVSKQALGPVSPATSASSNSSPSYPKVIRPAPPPFIPHVMMRPRFIPPSQPNHFALPFLPPQLRLPLPSFARTAFIPSPSQPAVIESGPSLYNDKSKKDTSEVSDKDDESGTSAMKTQVLSSDVELVALKKQADNAHKASYLGRVMRGEKKMKRFLRCGGGQCWEDNSLAEWDPNDFRIFCGDLGNEVSDELLAKAFRKYPSFQKAKVIRENRTNKSKGYGFVSFKHQDDFVRACREMDGKYVGNRPIKLRKSNWKERSLEVVRKKQKQRQKLGLA
ncbi:hypothetical protein AB6A40_003253 [Gnathostoma spinigerum]|uniref:RNA-binding protein 42 n=1 Tax=Gnathostoma spinigerum TaxID=75299 RepID=A0ABD6E914_9BILA